MSCFNQNKDDEENFKIGRKRFLEDIKKNELSENRS